MDLGLMDYEPCTALQREILEDVVEERRPNTLLLVEHPPVLTLGANFHESNLLLSSEEYARRGIELVRTDRGGDVTYHGPRQLVVYPLFRISDFGKDLHKWMRNLEEAVIQAVGDFGLEGRRFPPNTGVWVGDRKIAAIGIKVRRWASMHGIALNCNNDLTPFSLIVPCGIKDFGVTSLSRELGREATTDEAKPAVVRSFEQVFGMKLRPQSR